MGCDGVELIRRYERGQQREGERNATGLYTLHEVVCCMISGETFTSSHQLKGRMMIKEGGPTHPGHETTVRATGSICFLFAHAKFVVCKFHENYFLGFRGCS